MRLVELRDNVTVLVKFSPPITPFPPPKKNSPLPGKRFIYLVKFFVDILCFEEYIIFYLFIYFKVLFSLLKRECHWV